MTERWLVNGRPARAVAADDRGLAYGDGLFETIAVRDGCLRFREYHLERIGAGCTRLGFRFPGAAEAEIERLAGGSVYGIVKLIVTRGRGPRGYTPPAAPAPTRIVGLLPAVPPPRRNAAEGVRVRYCGTALAESPALAGLKALGRLEQVLARAEWSDPEIAEGLMCTAGGAVTCGTISNLFIVSSGVLETPALDRAGVRGVMRRIILEQAVRLGIASRRRRIDRARLAAADEVFVCNSQFGIWPVREVEGRVWRVGPVTRRLMHALAACGVTECDV